MTRRAITSVLALFSAVALADAAAAQGTKAPAAPKSWKCTAPGLVNGSYDGGETAFIHLVGFTSGGNYAVTKDKSGKVVTGTTGNGTKFTCTGS